MRFASGQRDIETVIATRRGHPIGLRFAAESGLWRFHHRLPPRLRERATNAYHAIGRVIGSKSRP